MTASRSRHALLALLAALGLILAPHAASAGGAKAAVKPLPPRTQKVADKVLATATKAQKAKALGNLAEAMSTRQDLSRSTTKQAAFLERSVRSQNAAAKRQKPGAVARKPAPRNQVAKKKDKQGKQTKKTKKSDTGGGESPDPAEAQELDSDTAASDAAETDATPTRGGIVGRVQRYIAARRAFSRLARENPAVAEEFQVGTRLGRGYALPFVTGGSFVLAAASILTGGVVLGLVAGSAAAVGGAVEFRNRDSVRKELVQEMAAASKDKRVAFKLSKQEIATFEAAGWL